MAIKILANGLGAERKPGYIAEGDILAGQPVTLGTNSDGNTVVKVAGNSDVVFGFALETTIGFSNKWFMYDDYNRGGLVSYVAGKGFEIAIWDDGRGAVYNTSESFALGDAVYAKDGKITKTSNGNILGYVTKVPVDASDALVFQLA